MELDWAVVIRVPEGLGNLGHLDGVPLAHDVHFEQFCISRVPNILKVLGSITPACLLSWDLIQKLG